MNRNLTFEQLLMKRIIIIGAGISGLSIACLLNERYNITIFERDSRPGGMVKCDVVKGNLFHRTGGHVFNTKRQDVLDWFWQQFDYEKDFTKALRNASVAMDGGKMIPYPIENHVYLFDEQILKSFIDDLVCIARSSNKSEPKNFEEFLHDCFGTTLYNIYFQPYNYKVWRRDLTKVPLSWLVGKLPMPSVQEMIYNNIRHVEEQDFVHSSFYYPRKGGSQFIVNRMVKNLDIRYNSLIEQIKYKGSKWIVNGEEADKVIYCGNIKQLPSLLLSSINIDVYVEPINELEFHGTTSVFCEIEKNPYSWIYMPSRNHDSHRIICTGNFAESNNAEGKMTATIEFTDSMSKEDILSNLFRIPYSPKYLTHHYEMCTYPIQSTSTREMIDGLKKLIEPKGFYLLGRFAEWEYYNMDMAIGAAIDLSKRI